MCRVLNREIQKVKFPETKWKAIKEHGLCELKHSKHLFLKTNPDAPCTEYLPTFTIKFRLNVGKYSIHGACIYIHIYGKGLNMVQIHNINIVLLSRSSSLYFPLRMDFKDRTKALGKTKENHCFLDKWLTF